MTGFLSRIKRLSGIATASVYPGMGVIVRRFARNEHASVTIEFLMWLPFYLFLGSLAADSSFIFRRHAHMTQVASTTARLVGLNDMTKAQGENYARKLLGDRAYYTVAVNDNGTNGVQVRISVAISNISLLGFALPGSTTIATTVVHRKATSVVSS